MQDATHKLGADIIMEKKSLEAMAQNISNLAVGHTHALMLIIRCVEAMSR
eukprot:COSAG06_NODE_48865_length_329_cov_0.678261_1_plen_49_part_10